MRIKTILLFLFIGCNLLLSHSSIGQDEAPADTTKKDKNVSFAPVPYINYSRTAGFEFGAVPMLMYGLSKKDTISPDALTGLVVKYTTEGNWLAMYFQKLFWKEDTWRLVSAGGIGYNGFQFIPDVSLGLGNEFLDYATDFQFFYIEVQRNIVGRLYGGLNFYTSKTSTEILSITDEKNFTGVGAKFSWDDRSNVYYPKNGLLANAQWVTLPEILDNEFVSNKIDMDYNYYKSFRGDKDVLATRLKAGFGIGDLAFEQQYIVGRTDIRGYTQGEFRGNYLVAIQTEYRWNAFKNVGFVAFVGAASTESSQNAVRSAKFLPGAGGGIRVTVLPKNHMNVGLDAAVGYNDWGIYFRIGEAF